MEALERISANEAGRIMAEGQQAGPRRLCQAPAAHPFVSAKPKSGEAGQVGGRGEGAG